MLFIYIIYHIFVNQNFSSKNPWQVVAYFFGIFLGGGNALSSIELSNPSSNTIEWTLQSPIPLHAFNSLPVQS